MDHAQTEWYVYTDLLPATGHAAPPLVALHPICATALFPITNVRWVTLTTGRLNPELAQNLLMMVLGLHSLWNSSVPPAPKPRHAISTALILILSVMRPSMLSSW